MPIEKTPLGCMGSKKNELKYLLPIIKENINEDTIFIEPFCGSCIVSYNVFKLNVVKGFHINDRDEIRMKFYNNMTDETEREKLYKIEDDIIEKGEEEYFKYVDKNKLKTDYISYVIGRRIHKFRYGLFPIATKITSTKISDNWLEFLTTANKTTDDWKVIMEKYKDNKNAFIYLDPPYLESYNANYCKYEKSIETDGTIIDNTKIYIDILNYLKNAKCKILFSINKNAITEHTYKDFINNTYNKKYSNTYTNNNKKNTDILIITNF